MRCTRSSAAVGTSGRSRCLKDATRSTQQVSVRLCVEDGNYRAEIIQELVAILASTNKSLPRLNRRSTRVPTCNRPTMVTFHLRKDPNQVASGKPILFHQGSCFRRACEETSIIGSCNGRSGESLGGIEGRKASRRMKTTIAAKRSKQLGPSCEDSRRGSIFGQ